MSSGSDSDVVLDVRVTGSGTLEGGGTQTQGGAEDEGLIPDPEFRKVAQWSQSADVTAAESVLARNLRWIPFVNASIAENVAEGVTAGYYSRSVREGFVAGGQLTDSVAGQIGGAFGGAAGRAVGGAGSALPPASSAVGSLGLAAAGAAATIAGLEVSSRAFGRALDTFARTIEGSALMQSLRLRQQTQVQMQREMRALAVAPTVASLVDTQTRRQVEMEQLTGSISLAFSRVLQPFADYMNLILEILNDVVGPLLQRIVELLVSSMWLLRVQHRVWSAVWNWIKQRFGIGDAEVNPDDFWMKALDPTAEQNQPFGEDEVDAGLFNPAGGRLNR